VALAENKNGRLAWKVHVGRPFGVPLEMRLLDWVYVASWKRLETDTLMRVSAWKWGLFGKRLSLLLGQKGCSHFLVDLNVLFGFPNMPLGWDGFVRDGFVFIVMGLLDRMWMGVWDTTGEARRFARLLEERDELWKVGTVGIIWMWGKLSKHVGGSYDF